MKSKFLNSIMFISVIISLIISLRLFWNIGIFSDEYSSSPGAVLGGDFWLYMDWVTFPLLLIMCFISLGNMLRTKLVISTSCFIIIAKLFWNTCIFVDEFATPLSIVYGGDFWLYMSWLRLLLITIVFFLSVINIFPIKKTALYLRWLLLCH